MGKNRTAETGIRFKTLDKIRFSLEIIPAVSSAFAFFGGLMNNEIGPASWIVIENLQISRILPLITYQERPKENEILNTQVA